MTDNLPAVQQHADLERREAPIHRADTDSWTQQVASIARLAQEIAGTEFVPKDLRGKPAAVTAAILYGREVGFPPMTALTQTNVIEGKPSTSAEGMRALVLAAGHEIVTTEATGSAVTMRARRRGSSTWTELTWTTDMVRAAGLDRKDNHKRHPRQMLTARCSAELIRLVFPDVIHGLMALEEIEDERDDDTPAETVRVGRDAAPAPRARKAVAARKTTAAKTQAPAPSSTSSDESGLPLPGEDGYDEPPTPPAAVDRPAAGEGPTAPETAPEPDEGTTTPEPAPEPEEPPVDEPEAVVERATPGPASRAQVRMVLTVLSDLEKKASVELERDERLRAVRILAGRDELESTSNLTKLEASGVLDLISKAPSLEALLSYVDELEQRNAGEETP